MRHFIWKSYNISYKRNAEWQINESLSERRTIAPLLFVMYALNIYVYKIIHNLSFVLRSIENAIF